MITTTTASTTVEVQPQEHSTRSGDLSAAERIHQDVARKGALVHRRPSPRYSTSQKGGHEDKIGRVPFGPQDVSSGESSKLARAPLSKDGWRDLEALTVYMQHHGIGAVAEWPSGTVGNQQILEGNDLEATIRRQASSPRRQQAGRNHT